MTPAGRRGAGAREDILDAAVALLTSVGLDGFSASALAAKAGVSKANIFHHFASTEMVVLESFERFATGMTGAFPPPGADPRRWLKDFGESWFGLDDNGLALARTYIVFVSKAMFDEALVARVRAAASAALAGLAESLTGLAAEVSPDTDPRVFAQLVFMTADGMAMNANLFPQRRAEFVAAWDLFVDRLVARPPAAPSTQPPAAPGAPAAQPAAAGTVPATAGTGATR